MKKIFLLIPCLALSAAVAHSQTQSGSQSGAGGAGNTGAQQTSGAANNRQQPGQINPEPGAPATGVNGNGAIINQPAGANRISGVTPGGDTNRIPFGGTNQIQFGVTNNGRLINEPSGANPNAVNPPGQVPFGTGQPVPFGTQNQGAVNQGTGLPTNNTPLAGSGTIQEPSGAANPNNPAGAVPPNAASADAVFAQQLKTALSRGGATRIFFPQTRSTVTLVNQNGSILLSGTVANQQEKNEIEAKVKNASGVASVNNQLQIANQNNRPVSPIQNPPQTGTENQRQLLNP